MTKKLNTGHIRNELADSVFRAPQQPSMTPTPGPAENLPAPPVPALLERSNARTPERATGRRIITRNSFEIYEDQMQSLRARAYQEKMTGKLAA